MYRNKHHLEHAVDHLVERVLAEEHPGDMAVWAVAALAAALDVPAAVGVVGDVDSSIEIIRGELADLIRGAGTAGAE